MEEFNRGAGEPRLTLASVMVSFPARLTCYAIIAFVLVHAVFLGLIRSGSGFIGAENGPVEMAQVYLALFTSICMFVAAFRSRRGRAGLITCGAMVGYAAARESDTIFETVFFDDAYKYLVGLPLLVASLTALAIDRRRVVRDALWLVRQPAVAFFALGGIYLCTFCQILDRPDIWRGISSPDEAMQTKAMVEEFAELFAYAILGFSGIEALALAFGLDVVETPATNDTPVDRSDGIDLDPPIRIAA